MYGIAVYYAVVAFTSRSERHIYQGVAAFLVCGLAVAILALLGVSWPDKVPIFTEITERLPRLVHLDSAPAGFSPNQVAGTLLWVLPVNVALAGAGLSGTSLFRSETRRRRWLVVIVGLCCLAMLVTFLLTQSRSGLAGLIAALAIMVLAPRLRGLTLILAGLIVAILLIAALWVMPLTRSLSGSTIYSQSDSAAAGAVASSLDTLDVRVEIWSRALYGLEDFPLTGMGVGTFRRVAPALYPLFLVSPSADIAHAHNHLLQAGLDLGMPGLIAYLALWLLTAVMLWHSWKLRRDKWQGALIIGYAGSMAGYFTYGMTDAVALGAKPGFIYWLALGLIAGQHRWLAEIRQPAG